MLLLTHKATKFFSQSRSLRAQTGTQASSCSYLFMSFKIFSTVFCSWEFKSLIDSEWGKKRFKWLVVLFTIEINKCMNSKLLCQLQICITVKNCCLCGSFQQMVLISLRPLYETFVFSRKCPTLLSKNLTAPKHKVNPNKQIAICIFRMRPFISNRHSFVRQLYVVIKFCRTEQRINCLSYFTP